MNTQPSSADARAALDEIERSRQRVIDEIDMPRWYWRGLAIGWVALGIVTDLRHPVITAVATFAFGTVHAAVSQVVIGGRHRTTQLSVRADVVGRHVPLLVVAGLIGMALVTIAGALLASADHAHHPVTLASVVVALLIVLGGPQLMAAIRGRAVRAAHVS